MMESNSASDGLLFSGKKAYDTSQNAYRSRPLGFNHTLMMKNRDILPGTKIPRTKVSWSIYKQMITMLQPKKLSCLVVVSNNKSDELKTKVMIKEMQELEKDIQTFIANETPIERIKRTFSFNVNTGKYPVQFQRVNSVIHSCIGLFFCFGAVIGFFEGRKEFVNNHKMTMFATKGTYHKRRALHQAKGALKHGVTTAMKGGLFCGSSIFLYHLIEIYMNKSSPWSFALAVGTVGSICKIGLGPKGMFSGFMIGSVLGSVAGLLSYGVLKITGETQEELNYNEVKGHLTARRKYAKKEMYSVTEYHEDVDDIE